MCFGSSKNTTTNVTEIPEFIEDAAKDNISRAQDLADQPYQAYTGERVQGFSEDQNAAFDLVSAGQDRFTGPNGYSDAIMDTAGAPIMQHQMGQVTPGSFEEFMNPYISSVMGDTLREFDQGVAEQMLGINAGATQAGAFGDARHGVAEAQFREGAVDQRGQLVNRIMADAFNSAAGLRQQDITNQQTDIAQQLQGFNANLGAYEGGLNRMIGGSQAAMGVDTADLANYLNYAGALNQSGAQQQNLGQMELDNDYQDFLAEQNYPIEMINLLNQTVSMQPRTTSTTSTSPGPSPASQALGLAAGIGSFFI